MLHQRSVIVEGKEAGGTKQWYAALLFAVAQLVICCPILKEGQTSNKPPLVTPAEDSNLQIQTSNLSISPPQPLNLHSPSPPLPPLPFVSQTLTPTHVKINQFGSRFLPHATSPIRCLLPLESDRLLLIGHDEGLSVLDMFPQEWNDGGGISVKGPDEAQSRLIWQGERQVLLRKIAKLY